MEKEKKISIVPLATITIIFTITMSMVQPMIPLYASFLGANEIIIGIIVAVAPFIAIFCDIPIGSCASYIGLERMLQFSFLVGIGSGIFYIFSSTPFMLIIPQLGFGLTFALFMPQLINYYYRISTLSNRKAMQGFNTAFQGVGFLIGPFVAGLIGQQLGLRWIFVFYTGLSLIGYLISRIISPLKLYKKPAPLYQLALTSYRRSVRVVLQKAELKQALVFIVLLTILWQGLGNTIFPLYIDYYFPGITILVGILLTVREAGSIVIRLLFARISRHLSLQVILAISIVFMAVGSFLIPFLRTPVMIGIASLIIGIGLGSTFPGINLLVLESAEEEEGPLTMATANAFSKVSLTVAAPILGAMVSLTGFSNTFWFTSSFCICLLLGITFYYRRKNKC